MFENDPLIIIKPFYLLSVLFCVRKYKLKGKNVSATTKKDLVAATFGNIFIYIMLYFTLTEFFKIFDKSSLFFLYIITYVFYATNYTMHSVLSIIETKRHTTILLNLQKINKILQNDNDSRILKLFITIAIILLFIIYLALVITKFAFDPLWFFARCMFIFLTITFDLEILYTSLVILFLALKIERWSNLVNSKTRIISIKEMIREVESEEDVMFEVFEKIFNTIVDVEKVSKLTILNHLIMQLLQSLAYVQIWIEWMKNNMSGSLEFSSHTIGVVLWITKGTIIEIVLSVSCEILYKKVVNAKVVILLYLIESYTSKDRQFAKKVLRILKNRYKKLNSCGVVTIEAALPLKVAALVANYTIVLLQFAFV